MKLQRSKLSALVLVLIMTSCAAKNSTTPSTPANVQMASLSKALADALSTASKSVITLRDNGTISQKETLDVQGYILVAANSGKQMDAQLVSASDWPTQKAAIIKIWTTAGLSTAKSQLSPTAGVILDTIINVVNQILAAVGGPAI